MKYMGKEIERKFLVKEIPDLSNAVRKEVRQGYMVADEEREERVRDDGQYWHTKKAGSGRSRDEDEQEIDEAAFDVLWDVTEGQRVYKTRFTLDQVEVDVYHRNLEGLVTAEVEFGSDAEADAFEPLPWFGREITDDARFKNKRLKDLTRAVGIECAKFPYALDEGVRRMVEAAEECKIVHVAGGSASGKTSQVALKLAASGDDSTVIPMDDYYKGATFVEENGLNFDMPLALDLELLASHLEKLRQGVAVEKPVYSFKTGEREGYEVVHAKGLVVVEGLFALDAVVRDAADLRVFVDIGMHGRAMRRLLRDVVRTSWSPQDILGYFAEVVEPMHEEYVQSTMKNADLVIRNEYNPAVEASRARGSELQVKFLCSYDDNKLQALGAERLMGAQQRDVYYNPADRDLRHTGEALRIREEGDVRILTYKGPVQESSFRKRPKFECEIPETVRESLLKLYGSQVRDVRKYRTLYRMGEAILSVDDVVRDGSHLGKFLEIRAQNEEQLEAAIAKLELSEPIKESYVEYSA